MTPDERTAPPTPTSPPASTDPGAPRPRKAAHVRATWVGEQRFDSGRPDGPSARLDGTGATGQSPVDMLLSALAACSGIDVADYLTKRRTPASRLTIDVYGERREPHPRRFMRIEMHYHVTGEGIDPAQTERAVRLAIEKYCTVAASLAPDIELWSVVVLNGERFAPVAQPTWKRPPNE